MSRQELIKQFGEPDNKGHITRYSDSSLYDEKCVLCGATDSIGNDKLAKGCPYRRSK